MLNWAFPFSTFIKHTQRDRGKGWTGESTERIHSFQRGNPQRGSSFCPHSPPVCLRVYFLQRALKAEVKEISVAWSLRTAAAKGRLVQRKRERTPASRVMSQEKRLSEPQLFCRSFKQLRLIKVVPLAGIRAMEVSVCLSGAPLPGAQIRAPVAECQASSPAQMGRPGVITPPWPVAFLGEITEK